MGLHLYICIIKIKVSLSLVARTIMSTWKLTEHLTQCIKIFYSFVVLIPEEGIRIKIYNIRKKAGGAW